jgi:hypothetical protein
VFAGSLALVAAALAGLLFGVSLEALAPATGTVTARDLTEVRAALAGLVELGWYEGQIDRPEGAPLAVRLDGQGNGRTDPTAGGPHLVGHGEWYHDGRRLPVRPTGFHRLQAGDDLWPGQPLAAVHNADLRARLGHLDDQIKELESRGESTLLLRRDRDRLRERLAQAVLHVPAAGDRWLAVAVPAEPGQAVRPGDPIAVIVPVDRHTGQPLHLRVRLEIEEKHWADVRPGQAVRLQSAVYNHRLYGHADGRIDRLEPAADGSHYMHAEAAVTAAPFALPLGSAVRAEVLVGRKPVYRIILEH